MSSTTDFIKGAKEMSVADLKSRIKEDQLRLKKLEFAHAITPLENPMTLRNLRKDIARLQTELRSKELVGSSNHNN
jgi:large subunit ribosomal protein L29